MCEVYEGLAQEYWDRKSEFLLDRLAQNLLSPLKIPHAGIGIEVRPPTWETCE